MDDSNLQKNSAPPAGTEGWGREPGLWWAVALALLTVIVFLSLAALIASDDNQSRARSEGPVICLDPGHGGRDPGALENGIPEKEANLDIARRTRKLLESRGYRVVMTRDRDEYVSLARRCEIARETGASLFVSVHNNSRPPDVQGTTTYYYRDSEEGRRLALHIQAAVVRAIGRPDRGIRRSGLYVVRNSDPPAALLEGIFLSDSFESKLMRYSEFRQAMAEGLAIGIDGYVGGW